MPERCVCGEDEYGHMPHCPVPLRELEVERDRYKAAVERAYRLLTNMSPGWRKDQLRHDHKWASEAKETLRLAIRATNQTRQPEEG